MKMLLLLFVIAMPVVCVLSENVQKRFLMPCFKLLKLVMDGKDFFYFIAFEIFLCYLILYHSNLELTAIDKLLCILVTTITSLNFDRIKKYSKEILTSKLSLLMIFIASIYGAFALVANRIFLYPINLTVSLKGICIFIFTTIYFIPIVLLFIGGINHITKKHKNNMSTLKFCVITSCLIAIPAIFALIAYNPGISSQDTKYCLAIAAHALRGMNNWHPPFYCALLKVIISIWDSTYAVIFIQIVFFVYVFLELFLLVRSKGFNENILILFAIFIGFNPANYIHAITIWKDVPYTYSLLWLTVLFAKIILQKMTKFNYVELFVSLVFTFFMRQNGIVVYFVALIILAIINIKDKKTIITLCTSFLIIIFIRFPMYSYLEVKSSNAGHYVGLSQDIMGAYFSGGNVSDETKEMIDIMINNQTENYMHNPYWANYSMGNLSVGHRYFIKCYIDTFFKNPKYMLRAIILRQDFMFDIFTGKNAVESCVNYYGEMKDDVWNKYYPERKENFLTPILSKVGIMSVNVKVIFWRSGLYVFVAVLLFIYIMLRIKRKSCLFIFVPFVGQILSLMLSTGWSDFRYYWPLNLMTVAIFLLTICFNWETE